MNMLKKIFVSTLIIFGNLVHAQVDVDAPEKRPVPSQTMSQMQKEYYQEIKARFNPLKCERNEWSVGIDNYEKRGDAAVSQVMNLIMPPKNETWTSISNFLEVDPKEGLNVHHDGSIYLKLQEIKHVAVPSSYSYLKQEAVKKLVADLKTIPGAYIHCVVYAAAGARLSGSNKKENTNK